MSRKRRKMKRRSCAMCKAWKMGGENRWKPSEAAALSRHEKATLHISRTDEASRHWDLTA